MKRLLLILGVFLSLPALAADSIIDTVVLSPEEILTNKAPLTCKVFRRKDGSVSFLVGVAPSSGANGHFEGFDLRVLTKPMAAFEIKERLRHKELWAWHRPSSSSPLMFVLTEEEIPKSYIVGRWSLARDPSIILQVKEVCFSVEALVKQQPEGPAGR